MLSSIIVISLTSCLSIALFLVMSSLIFCSSLGSSSTSFCSDITEDDDPDRDDAYPLE